MATVRMVAMTATTAMLTKMMANTMPPLGDGSNATLCYIPPRVAG
jgi:hypothetical protein